MKPVMKAGSFLAGLSLVFVLGCGGGRATNAEKGAVTGAVVGAGGGAVVGHQLGNTGVGAAVGGVSGAATGAVVGAAEDRNFKDTVEVQQELLKKQEQEIKRQNSEIEDLNRQKYHNDSLRRFEKPTSQSSLR